MDSSEPPAKKKRELPSSWSQDSGPSTSTSKVTGPINRQQLSKGKVTEVPQTAASGKRISKVFLSQEQSQILKLVENGMSVFYTGSAGTGKSVLLREIIKTMRKKHAKSMDAVAITASTGELPAAS
ncbi:hypothetical protein MPER_16390 [Moniliophthora perniciosa FA553]|nr:hypothetical protein MPER_16390 [Moniliophthora perniciosa FA553]